MRRIAFSFRCVLLAFFSLWQTSCDSESSQIGSDFFNNPSLDISSVDTASVMLSTIKFDSLVITEPLRTLLGSYDDNKLGRIMASTCFLPSLTDASALDDPDIVFEDISIVLKYDGYSYYDTAKSMTVYVHQLANKMEPASDGNLYNTTRFPLEETALGELTFVPRPGQKDSIEIFLDRAFGESLFNNAKGEHQDFETNDRFQKYIKGFAIVPDTSASSSIIGLDPVPELRLYYVDRNVVPAQSEYISYSGENGLVSSMISADRRETKLHDLADSQSRMPAIQSDNEAYLQAGAGLALRIDLPYLRDLKQHGNFYVTKSVLQVQPVYKSYDKFTVLPGDLDVHMVNYKNSSMGEYTSDATLVEDLYLGRDSYYVIDATAFVKGQMETEQTNENALVLLFPEAEFRSGVDRIYFADAHTSYTTRLIIYYATIMQ